MELKLIWRIIRRWWYLILIPVVIVGIFTVPDFLNRGVAVDGGFLTHIKYSAAQEFNLPDRDGDYQDVWLASEFTVNAFTEWILSNTFREELADHVEDVNLAAIGIAADNSRSVGVVDMSYPDAEILQSLADASVDILKTRSQEYFPQLGGEPAQVTILEEPVIIPTSPSLPNRFGPFIKLAIALMAGIALALLAEYLDTRVRYRDDVERAGLPVLGAIPKHK